jgi:hypothetical protein
MKIQVQPLENAGPLCLLAQVPPADGSRNRPSAAPWRNRLPVRFGAATEFAVLTPAPVAPRSRQPLSINQCKLQ